MASYPSKIRRRCPEELQLFYGSSTVNDFLDFDGWIKRELRKKTFYAVLSGGNNSCS